LADSKVSRGCIKPPVFTPKENKPAGSHFFDVSLLSVSKKTSTNELMENQAYLLLGSNLGERMAFLRQARQGLESCGIQIGKTSGIYRSTAWGIDNQPDFLNQVLEIFTDKTAVELLAITQKIEKEAGRKRDFLYQARTLDIDLLYFNSEVINRQTLTIPHPQLHKRRFTLIPLVEIAPDFVHPVFQLNNSALLTQCTDAGEVWKQEAATS
jgi:2-amino-4-hydroxy-6-hydroxymethyldihydropteridine diphosphokinase